MGATKVKSFTERQNSIAMMMKALGHPARIAIVEYLLKAEDCICGDIVNELPLAQPTVSQHLKALKMAGLIKGNVEGTAICYCIDGKAIEKLKKYTANLSVRLEEKNNCC